MQRCLSVAVVGAAVGVASARPKADRVAAIKSGKVPKTEVEVVLAQHNEDLSWSDDLDKVRTVYCKGDKCSEKAIKLPNVGREGQTYLHHILSNWESLADWTVFSQAEAPSDGYFGQGRGGGHLVSGSSFDDYLVPDGDSHFVFSSKVHIPSMQHAIRKSFLTDKTATAARMAEGATCPAAEGEDSWEEFRDISPVRRFIAERCNIEEQALGPALEAFWEDFVKRPLPANGMVHYAQGARFAVSRERLHQRPKAHYEQLLKAISEESDPCLNYLYEYAWFYLMGQPETDACASTLADVRAAAADAVPARTLQSGGVSGEEVGDAVFTGEMHLEVPAEEAQALADDPVFAENVTEGIASSLNLPSSYVEVTVTAERRLAERKLQSVAHLIIDYTITIPEAARADYDEAAVTTSLTPDTDASATFTSMLAETITASSGVTVTVEELMAPTVTGVATTTTAAEASGALRHSAGVAALVTAVAAALA